MFYKRLLDGLCDVVLVCDGPEFADVQLWWDLWGAVFAFSTAPAFFFSANAVTAAAIAVVAVAAASKNGTREEAAKILDSNVASAHVCVRETPWRERSSFVASTALLFLLWWLVAFGGCACGCACGCVVQPSSFHFSFLFRKSQKQRTENREQALLLLLVLLCFAVTLKDGNRDTWVEGCERG